MNSMKQSSLIEFLYKKYECEAPHCRHVAHIALTLFEGLQNQMQFTASMKKILHIAALLHDIGYAQDPASHAEKSAEIVLKEQISGISESQKRYCAAVILLHRKDFRSFLHSPLITSLRYRETVLRCAALLRIADGLDHSHIQDARIKEITTTPSEVIVTVTPVVYAKNIEYALQKADLFKQCFKTSLTLQIAPEKQANTFSYTSLLDPDEPSMQEAARKLLYYYYRLAVDTIGGAIKGEDPEYLHDFRVALRRFRTIARSCKQFLPHKQQAELDKTLTQLLRELGVCRDSDIRTAYVSQLIEKVSASQAQHFYPCLEKLQTDRDCQKKICKERLLDQQTQLFVKSIARFLRVHIPAHIRQNPQTVLLSKWTEEKVQRFLYRITQIPISATMKPEKLHALRKVVRQARYVTESFLGVLPPSYGQYAKFFKSYTTTLGKVHDFDIILEMAENPHYQCPQHLVKDIHDKRKKMVQKCKKKLESFISHGSVQTRITEIKKKMETKEIIIYIMRHGIAQQRSPLVKESERKLIPKGKKKVLAVGNRLNQLKINFDLILTSPYTRAFETASILAQSLSPQPKVLIEQMLEPAGSFDHLIEKINALGISSCCLIGHEPDLGRLLSYLLCGNSAAFTVTFKKAAICSISFSSGVEKGKGTLLWLAHPKLLQH